MNEPVSMNRRQVIIATVGLCGVGKSEASRFVAVQLRSEVVYFGGIVADEICRRGMAVTPAAEKVVTRELREEKGMDVVARMAAKTVEEVLSRGTSVVIDGLYSFAEYQFLRETFGPKLVVVALHAKKATRYARLSARQERPFAPAEVDSRDHHEILHLAKAPPIVLADHHIVNDGSIEHLQEALGAILNEYSGRETDDA